MNRLKDQARAAGLDLLPERPYADSKCHHCGAAGPLHYFSLMDDPKGQRTRSHLRYMPYCSPECFIRGAVLPREEWATDASQAEARTAAYRAAITRGLAALPWLCTRCAMRLTDAESIGHACEPEQGLDGPPGIVRVAGTPASGGISRVKGA